MRIQLGVFAATALPFLACSVQAQSFYNKPCPLIDANYPTPSQLASSNDVRTAANTTLAQILASLDTPTAYGQFQSNATAFSVQVYSLHNDAPLFTYHFTPELLASQRTVGVESVDSDTIYRLGSVSKLWTVYIYLVAAGDQSWNDPITAYVPELAAIAAKNGNVEGDVDRVDWESVTVGALASQIAGIARDAAYSAGLSEILASFGIPDAGGNAHSTCGDASTDMLPCNRTAFFEDFPTQHPIFSPLHSPIYSNAAYQILSYALENITGKAMPDLFQQLLVEALSLTSTYYTVPPSNATSSGIIPINATASWWDADALDESPAGGFYSSINDMRKVGTAMLRSTQLSPGQTRRWMKPHSFLSDPKAAVGAPWEIMRAPGDPVSWMYTKAGDFGSYAATVALLPDFDVGFNVLGAGLDSVNAVRILSDIISETWMPALRAAAKAEAAATYAGAYVNSGTNSSMVISTTASDPGLVVSQWTYGGVDVMEILAGIVGLDAASQNLTMNLYPADLTKATCNGTQVSWRAIYGALPEVLDDGPFSQNCASWGSANLFAYGGVGLDEFLFTVDGSTGKAVALQPRVLANTLLKAR